MKSKITLFVFLLLTVSFCKAQTPDVSANGGEFIFNPDRKPCLTPEQRQDMLQTVKSNLEELQFQNRLSFSETQSGNHPLFIWPIQKASTTDFNDVWAISGYVDHNSAFNNNLLDYNCGSTTYDTSNYNHQGLDVYTWPFSWKLMDDDGVEIIAAAPGQIISISDGEFDRSCNFSTTTPWNAVYVQHSDGSVALYGHMKNGSTTAKNVGDMVAEGEYLGVVGSSGISTGPHLHFEVYESVVNNVLTGLIDPYAGNCNSLNNNDSWWANQKPYVNPKINAVLTHSQPPNIFPPCPTTETTHISNDFDADDTIYFATYLRDQTVGDNIQLEIIKPDNSSLFGVWNTSVTTTSSSWYYYWYYTGYFDMEGEWKWRVTFEGETVTHAFNVVNPLSIDENDFSETTIFPNPFNNLININSKTKVESATIVDVLGKTVLKFKKTAIEGIKELNLSQLSKGLYFVRLKGEGNQKKTIKLVKK